MKYPLHTDQEHIRRRRLAMSVIERGGTQREFATALGVSAPGALKWLCTYAPDLHRRLKGDHIKTLDAHTVLVRLLLLKSVEGSRAGRERLLRALGRSESWFYLFCKQWAPDGLDAAIADLMPDNGNGNAPLNNRLNTMITQPVHGAAHG